MYFTYYVTFSFLFILLLTILFCLNCWKRTIKYGKFPCYHLDLYLLYRIFIRKYRKKIPFSWLLGFSLWQRDTRVVSQGRDSFCGGLSKKIPFSIFQMIISLCKGKEKEGLHLIWLYEPHLLIYGEEFVKVFYKNLEIIDKTHLHEFLEEALGKGLVTSNGEEWRKQRKLIDPVFRIGKLKENVSLFNQHAEDLVKNLSIVAGQPTTEITEQLKICAFNIICESVMDIKPNDKEYKLKIRHFQHSLQRVEEIIHYRFSRPWLHWKFLLPFFASGREYLKLCKFNYDFATEIIQETEKNLISRISSENDSEKYCQNRKSLAEVLLIHKLNNPTFTTKDMKDEIVTFLIAGFDTVSRTLLWCLFLLGLHPEIQERAYEEIKSKTNNYVSYEDLSNLTYLDCIIKETLRLYPSVPIFVRKLKEGVQCGEYLVPKDTNIVIMIYMIHRNADVYPDPEKFDPDRFLGNSDIRPWMFIPFGFGYRTCIGKNFAMMEMKVILSHIIRNFEITSLDKREDIILDWEVLLISKIPLLMQLSSRKSNEYE